MRTQQPTKKCIHPQSKTLHTTFSLFTHTYQSFTQQLTTTSTTKSTLSFCHILRGSLILGVQPNSSFRHRLTLWFIAFGCVAVWTWILGARGRGEKMITFYSFIPLQQWPCHLGSAPIFCSVRGSASFMAMTETSGWFAWLQTSTFPGGEWPAWGKAQVEYSNLWIWTLAGGCGGGNQGDKAVGWRQCCYDTNVNANSRRQMNVSTRNRFSIHALTRKNNTKYGERFIRFRTQKKNMFTAIIKKFNWTFLHLSWESIIMAWTRFLFWPTKQKQ